MEQASMEQNQAALLGCERERTIASDLLEGVEQISVFTGLPVRQVYYLSEKGHLPGVFRLGRKICGLRSEIAAGLRARATSGKAA
jgi:predicted DNA-binding transcriptional regulator AlpA